MGDICEVCKKNPAKIQIGEHNYCFDCHNKMALKDMGIDNEFVYAKNMSVIEPSGKMHSFEIEHIVLQAHRRVSLHSLLQLPELLRQKNLVMWVTALEN